MHREQIQFVFFWYTKCSSAIAQIWIYGAFFVTKKSFNNEKLKKSTKWPKYTKTVNEVCHIKWYLVHVIELFSLYLHSQYLFSILVALFLLYFSLPISSYLFLLSAHLLSRQQSLLKFWSVKARIHCEMFLSDYCFMKCTIVFSLCKLPRNVHDILFEAFHYTSKFWKSIVRIFSTEKDFYIEFVFMLD